MSINDVFKILAPFLFKINKSMKSMACSPDSDTDFFDIVIGVLQGDLLTPYLFIICLYYI